MTDPYEDLALAIVMQSVKDWREAVHELKKWPRDKDSRKVKNECEQFILSDCPSADNGGNNLNFPARRKGSVFSAE